MRIKDFTALRDYKGLKEELIWRYCYHAEKLKRILRKQIY